MLAKLNGVCLLTKLNGVGQYAERQDPGTNLVVSLDADSLAACFFHLKQFFNITSCSHAGPEVDFIRNRIFTMGPPGDFSRYQKNADNPSSSSCTSIPVISLIHSFPSFSLHPFPSFSLIHPFPSFP